MAHSYNYALIKLAPDDARGECLNIGAVVFRPEGIDVRLARRLEKIRAISTSIDTDVLKKVIEGLCAIDRSIIREQGNNISARYESLSRVGPINLSGMGELVSDSTDQYESLLANLIKDLIDPEPMSRSIKAKKSKLLTQLKKELRRERILAQRDDTLDDHRIIPKIEVGEGMVADLVLKNGIYHVIETADVSRENEALRKAIGEIGMSALILEGGRIKFGENNTRSRFVYRASSYLERHVQSALDAVENQGSEIINWQSISDRNKFIGELAQIAIPIPKKNRRSAGNGSNSQMRFS